MIKKLQKKFILLSMSALFAVLVVIITGINIVNYDSIIRERDDILMVLSENKGKFPSDNRGKEKGLPKDMSPETPYETRYFSVTLNSESLDIIQVETSRIISVDTTEAIQYAKAAADNHKKRGFINNFRYLMYEDGNSLRIIFLDCGRTLDSFQNFLFISIGIALAGFFIVFVIISFFSNKIIRPLSESYEKQKRFITDAGHEIKTPITIINADVDILEMEYGENEWLADIQKQAKRLSALTNDLVYLARMEETDNTLLMVDFPISDIVSEAASSFQALAQTQNKEFTCSIQPMLSMYGNEKSIHQLVSILLDNALKYSPENGKLSLTLEKQNKTLRLSVFNTTENDIPKESLDMLFERFYRIESSHNSQTGGYGIGLSIAKAITASHNGRIHASSQDGHSLLITVTLPI